MVFNSHYEFPLETLQSFSGFNVHNPLYVIMKSAMSPDVLLFSQAVTKHRWAQGFTESPSSPLSPYLPLPCHSGHPQLSVIQCPRHQTWVASPPKWCTRHGEVSLQQESCSAVHLPAGWVSFLALTRLTIPSPPCQVTKNEPSCHTQLLLCSPYTH